MSPTFINELAAKPLQCGKSDAAASRQCASVQNREPVGIDHCVVLLAEGASNSNFSCRDSGSPALQVTPIAAGPQPLSLAFPALSRGLSWMVRTPIVGFWKNVRCASSGVWRQSGEYKRSGDVSAPPCKVRHTPFPHGSPLNANNDWNRVRRAFRSQCRRA